MAELVDALDSKSSSFGVWVRFPPRVQKSLDESLGFFYAWVQQIAFFGGAFETVFFDVY